MRLIDRKFVSGQECVHKNATYYHYMAFLLTSISYIQFDASWVKCETLNTKLILMIYLELY